MYRTYVDRIQPHSSRNFNRRLSLSMQFSWDWPGWAKPGRLFIVPVSREAEQRIIGGLRIVTIKSPIDGIDVIISLKLSRYLNYLTIRYKLDNCKIGHLYKFHYDLSRIWSSFFNIKSINCSSFKWYSWIDMNSFEAWNFLQFQCYQYDSQPNYPDKYDIIVIHAKEKRWRNALRGHWTKRSSTFFINKMAREMFPGDSSLFDNVLYWFVLVFPFFFSIFSFFHFFFFPRIILYLARNPGTICSPSCRGTWHVYLWWTIETRAISNDFHGCL